ncbi:cytosine-purine permease [Obba rivulosa]|uniref:Cytosine-purine permease n=1 Tax=Obba rivulosa TaxID=1052685 RepID=A0A8E2DMP8_9APHY|nr:cytosine-purine permease [Obba rivulosa]
MSSRLDEKHGPAAIDVEKSGHSYQDGEVDSEQPKQTRLSKVTSLLASWGIETNGIEPVPSEERIDTRLYQMFFIWFSANINVLCFGTGSVGPAFFGLGLRTSLITLLVVDLISCTIPAYFAVFGPKLGMRSMVQARYSWGYWAAMLPGALNVFSMQAFLILSCIIGGQTLASVSDHLDDTLGIVIIGLISLIATFFGYRVIHWYESVAWIPNAIIFVAMLGVGGKHLQIAPDPGPVSTASIVSFATTTASSITSWCTMTPDYGVYHTPNASSLRIFLYAYAGFFSASVVGHTLGATFAACAASVPSWNAGFNNGNNVGGLIEAVLSPMGGFRKFLIVVVALSIPSACAPTIYTFGSSFMTITPYAEKIPRYVYAVISTAILIPVGIIGATDFYSTFANVISIIGYWSTVFAAIIICEHVLFRKNSFELYDLRDFNTPSRLPLGIAAVLAFLCAFGMIIPCMSQVWYTGPIGDLEIGDIGILVGFGVACALYSVLRLMERMWYYR